MHLNSSFINSAHMSICLDLQIGKAWHLQIGKAFKQKFVSSHLFTQELK